MKTFTIIFTVFLLLTGRANGQQWDYLLNNDEVLDSILTWKFNGITDSVLSFRETHYYDSQARLTGQFEYLNDPAINVWVPYRKLEYTFDAWGNQTLNSVMYYESELGGYKGLSRTETVFDASGRKSQETYYGWDYENMTWANPTQTDFEYNEMDSLAWTYTRHLDSGTGIWDSTAKVQYIYQADKKLQQEIEWYPDDITQVMYPTYFHDYEYDVSGNRILEIESYYNHDNGVTYPTGKREQEFNNSHQRTKLIFYRYIEYSEYWLPQERYDFDWNDAGLMTYYAMYSVDEDTTWFPYYKEYITYSATNQILLETYFTGTDSGEWLEMAKRQYQYSGDNLLTEECYFIWDVHAGSWNENNHHDYAYDSKLRLHTDTYYAYINITHQIELVTRDYYYYSQDQPLGITEQKKDVVLIYPNPASDKLYIEMSAEITPFDFRIVDINGRIIHSQKSFSGKSIDVSGLSAGVYSISLQNKSEIHQALFMKK